MFFFWGGPCPSTPKRISPKYSNSCLLKETKLSMLPMKECAKFKKIMKVDTRLDMCAGNRVIRRIDAYQIVTSK